jgi:ankyrin repeat protein
MIFKSKNEKLLEASKKGDVEKVKKLLKEGADVNAKDKYDMTPLHSAARNGHIEVVKLLIEKGAYVNANDKNGWTPLHFAAFSGHIEVVMLLLEHGADPNIKNNEGKTAIDIAREKRHFDIAKLIEEFISFQILSIESPKLFVNDWGKIIVKIKGKGKVSINLEGDIEWKDLGTKEISGESTIEIPVKPKISGEVPVKVIANFLYGKNL